MIAEDLLKVTAFAIDPAAPLQNPLTDVHALQEAQLLDIRLDALSATLGLLF